MRRINPNETTILDAQGSTGAGQPVNVEGFRHIVISVATDGGGDANLTCKFQGAIAGDAPTFTNSQAVDNMWDYVQVKDLQDGSSVNGDTGFSVAGADDYRLFEVNVNNLRWFNARVTARSAGEVTVKVKLAEN